MRRARAATGWALAMALLALGTAAPCATASAEEPPGAIRRAGAAVERGAQRTGAALDRAGRRTAAHLEQRARQAGAALQRAGNWTERKVRRAAERVGIGA
jgi:type IV secretory pathway TrbL component